VQRASADPVGAFFEHAVQCYRQGALERADVGLAELLELDPTHFDALHLQGLIAARLGRPERAVELIRRAIGQNAAVAAAHRHLGNALRDLGRFEEAIASYAHAIECRPDFKEAYVNRAMTLLLLRRPAEALADLDRAVALGADDAQVLLYRGSALIDLRRPADAAVCCERAMKLNPDLPDAYVNHGIALYLLGSFEAAAADCERALRLKADHAGAHAYLGAALHALRRLEDALTSLDAAIALDPQSAFAHNVRALCLLDLQRPQHALESCERAIALRPDLADAHNTRGLALTDSLRFEEAEASFDEAIALQPRLSEPYFNQGLVYLRRGDFERGWELYDRRPMIDRGATLGGAARLWDGSREIAGKTVFTYAEQGLGDTIQFCRYAILLRERGARVVLAVQDGLRALLRGLGPGIDVVGLGEDPGDFDFHCPLLSLARAFGTRLDSIPSAVPYLRPDPARVSIWRERLGTQGRLIGVRWQGSTGRADAGRSFHARHFEAIAHIPGVRMLSLQKGAGSEQLLELPGSLRIENLGAEFEPGGRDAFLDVAAVMECLELVITSDTSIAHLAGALGRPTWVLLKHVPDWRWLLDRDDSPWYPTMRLFRQNRPGDWSGVFDRVSDELWTRSAQPHPVL
jgi:tetratricopeptide (TPR) repeat protein